MNTEPPTTAAAVPASRPELLAPAGDWECARAAVENGADAIYFGLDRFNARMRAANFTLQDLPRLVDFLHGRGVRGYVTFNILVFTEELAQAEDYLRRLILSGVDAAIVQDVGICRLLRQMSPDFPLYASTQMSVTSAAGLEFAEDLGCSLVALARECSLREILQIQQERAAAALSSQDRATRPPAPFPLEVFVHGALCVAYSGQCLTSESLGGRSANRGECAQACRLPYELVCDGRVVALGDRQYLLSPQDLAGLPRVPDLMRAGVTSLKIEGRLKSPEYVANITRIYRRAIDQAWSRPTGPQTDLAKEYAYAMEMAFSRGLHAGWLDGTNNQTLVHGRFGKKRGAYLGQVKRLAGQKIILDLQGPVKPGDGVVFDAGRPDLPEEGGRIYTVDRRGREVALGFGQGDLQLDRIQPGQRIWKTSDPALDRELRQSFAGDKPRYTRPVNLQVRGRVGEPLTLVVEDEQGHRVEGRSSQCLVAAHSQPLTTERLREQLGRLGGTPFHLEQLRNALEGPVLLPVGELNRLRRECIGQLDQRRRQPRPWTLHPLPANHPSFTRQLLAQEILPLPSPKKAAGDRPPELTVLVRSLTQLAAVLTTPVTTIYCELEDPKKNREAVALVREAANAPSDDASPRPAPARTLWIAPPRISKPGDSWILQHVLSSQADGYLVRNFDHLRFFSGQRCRGDYSLNIANPLSAAWFIRRYRLERVTASYDLNCDQLEALLQAAPPEWFEVTVHQHMPLFHMEHCVFCAFLSQGTDYRNCGRPCEKHAVQLRDRVGAAHTVHADAGCRNTVFNARAQTGAEYVQRLIQLGLRHFRIELLEETAFQVQSTIRQYSRLLTGQIAGTELWRELKLARQLGVTRGTLDPDEPRLLMPQ